jgi:hypothetical protein
MGARRLARTKCLDIVFEVIPDVIFETVTPEVITNCVGNVRKVPVYLN